MDAADERIVDGKVALFETSNLEGLAELKFTPFAGSNFGTHLQRRRLGLCFTDHGHTEGTTPRERGCVLEEQRPGNKSKGAPGLAFDTWDPGNRVRMALPF